MRRHQPAQTSKRSLSAEGLAEAGDDLQLARHPVQPGGLHRDVRPARSSDRKLAHPTRLRLLPAPTVLLRILVHLVGINPLGLSLPKEQLPRLVDAAAGRPAKPSCTNTFSKYLDPNSEGEGAGLGQVGTKVS